MSTTHIVTTPNINNLDVMYYCNYSDNIVNAQILPPHVHDELEFYILIEGNVSFSVEHAIYQLSPGDVIISKPNEIHNCIINDATVHKHMCFRFAPTCDFLFSTFLEKEFGTNNHISLDDKSKKELFDICKSLEICTTTNDKQGELTYLLQFIYLLSSTSASTDKFKQIPENFQKILDYINVNFAEIISIDKLADQFFISRSTLCRLFSNYLHTSPKLYLEAKRLANSRILLKRGKSVIDACMESGFADYSNYIRLFKKRFGITPKRYKES